MIIRRDKTPRRARWGEIFNIEGTCDWCKQSRQLTKHEYIDGKAHYACQSCNDLARMDVRLFNLAEIAQQERQATQPM